MAQLLAPYHDTPLVWIREHKDQLAMLLDKYGVNCVLIALDNCLEAGKLDFFFQDFGRYKPAIRENEHGDYPRCPNCQARLQQDDNGQGFCCFKCRKWFRADLSEIIVERVDTSALPLKWRKGRGHGDQEERDHRGPPNSDDGCSDPPTTGDGKAQAIAQACG